MTFLLAIFQAGALVIFQHPMSSTKVTTAKTAIPYYALCRLLAVLMGAADLLWCATTQRESNVNRRGRRHVERWQGRVGRRRGREVFPSMDEAKGGRWKGSAYGEKLAKGGYRGWWRDGQRNSWAGGLVYDSFWLCFLFFSGRRDGVWNKAYFLLRAVWQRSGSHQRLPLQIAQKRRMRTLKSA